jgi:hypothetical protein
MTIKPEDISDEAFDEMDGDYYSDFGMDKEDFAAILNAAIEAGVVSPPCYALRKSENGELLTRFRVYTSREAANDCAPYRCKVEHWKGQTE